MKPLARSIAAFRVATIISTTIAVPQLHAGLLSYDGFDGGTTSGQALSLIGAGTSSGFATGWSATGITTNNAGYTTGAGTGLAWSNVDLVSATNLVLSPTAGSSLGTATNHSRFLRTLDPAAVAGVSGASTNNQEIWVSFMGQRNGTTLGGLELVSTANNRFLEGFGGFNTNNWNWSDRQTAGTGEVMPIASTNQAFVSLQLVFGATSTTIRMFVNQTGNYSSLTNVPSIENVIANTSNNRPNFDAISVYGGFRIDELRIGTTYADTAPVRTVLGTNAGATTWVGGTITTGSGALSINGTQDVAFDGTAATVAVDAAGANSGNGRLEFRTGGHSISGGALTVANVVNTAGANTFTNNVTARFANLAGGTSLTVNDATFTNGLYGSGSLLKTGAGTLTLSRASVVNADNNTVAQPIVAAGRNNYSGTLTLSQGTLRVTASNAAGTGPIVIGDASTGSSDTTVALPSVMTLANPITVTTNGTGVVTLGSVTGASGVANFSGLTTLNRPTTFTSATTDRTEWTGKITGNVGTLTIAGGQRTVFSNLTNDFVGDIVLSGANTVLQTGVVAGTEHIPNGSSINVGTGAFLKFAGAANSTETINALNGAGIVRRHEGVGGLVTMVLGSAGGSGQFSGGLENGAGTLAVTKAGPGTQIFAGAATYTGPTTVTGGTLLANGSLSATNAVAVSNTASFGRTVTGTLNIGTLTLGSTAGDTSTLLTTLNSAPTTPSINVATSGGLVANGGTGTVTVNVSGVASAGSSYTLIDYSGTLGGGYGSFVLGTLPSRAVANLVDNAANSSIDLLVTASDSARWSGAHSSEWSTAILGGAKNWVLHSDGVFTTDFLVGDTVQFTDTAVSKTVSIDVADVAPGAVVFNNSTGNDYTLGGTKAIIGTTGIAKSGTGKLTVTNTNAFTGPVSIDGGVVSVAELKDAGVAGPLGAGSSIALSGGTLQVTAPASSSSRSLALGVGGGTLLPDGALGVGGVVSGAGAFAKDGAGTLTFSGANTYGGGTAVKAGRLVGATNSAFGTGAIVIGETSDAASLYLAQRADVANPVTVSALGSGTVVIGADNTGSGANASTFFGTLTLNRPTTFSGEVAGDRLAIDGQITGNVGTLTVNGGARTTFQATTNDFVGDLVVTGAGTILQASVAGAAEVIPNGSSVTVDSGVILQLASSGGAETINALNGAGIVRTFPTQGFGSNLTVGSAGGSGSFSGTLVNGTNALSLTKVGSGTQTLGGVNTYTGATSVVDGTLVVNGSISGSTTTINGGTLSGTGTVGALTLASGTIAPGASPGILHSGNTSFNGGSFSIEINGLTAGADYDQLDVTGSVNFGGPAQLSLSLGFNPLDDGSQSFTIVNNNSLNAISFLDAFSGFYDGATQLGEGAFFTVGGQEFAITYAGGTDANDVVLTAVPEPTSTMLIIAGAFIFGASRRRRA